MKFFFFSKILHLHFSFTHFLFQFCPSKPPKSFTGPKKNKIKSKCQN